MTDPISLKAMVVDDTATFRMIVHHSLVALGVNSVCLASDGEDGLKMLSCESDIGVIICDWHMHPMDGLTFCTKIKDVPELGGRTIPVIFMTSDPKLADPEKRARMLEPARGIGIVDVLPKPFTPADLAAVLNQTLGLQLVAPPPKSAE